MNYIRRSPFVHALVVFVVLSTLLLAPTSAQACMDCWFYYEVLEFRPSNWISAGYQPGDWVWIRTENINNRLVNTQWYVMEAGDPNWWTQPDPCCSNGPWYVTSDGLLYLIW